MEKITIKNISSANLVLSFDDLKFRRELVPGRSIAVSRDDYDEMTFDPGFNSLVEEHYLQVIGLEDGEEVSVEAQAPIFDRKMIEDIFDKQDITAFAKLIPTAAPAEKDSIVQIAAEKRITTPAFVTLIKKYCDTDIMAVINMRYLAEEN